MIRPKFDNLEQLMSNTFDISNRGGVIMPAGRRPHTKLRHCGHRFHYSEKDRHLQIKYALQLWMGISCASSNHSLKENKYINSFNYHLYTESS